MSCRADLHRRVQARHRLLIDHGDFVAADAAQLVLRHLRHVAALEPDRPPTIRPWLPMSRMMPSATVDLPQPDSPTRPIASPGITLQEKSITAGISPARVKKEIDRFSISRIGWVASWLGSDVYGFAHRFRPQSFRDSSRIPSASRFRPSTKLISAIAGTSGRPGVEPQQQAAGVDRRAPVGAFRREAEAEEAERPEQDRGVADAQAEIDDQRPARVGQDLPQHDVPRPLAAGLGRGHVVARLDVHRQAADDAEDPGLDAKTTATKMFSWFGRIEKMPSGSALKTRPE